jgi:hypothetical protein
MIIFEKEYCDESLYDLERDVGESIQGYHNPKYSKLPEDEDGYKKGVFTVTIEWKNE